MAISSVEIRDLFGTPFAQFKPRTITKISGANGTGKTSIISAIMAVFDGGFSPGWLRKGAKTGYIRLTLSDGSVITKTVTPKGTTLEIVGADGRPVSSPKQVLDGIADSMAINPCRLLLAKPQDLLAVLMEVMPLEFSPAEIAEASGNFWVAKQAVNLEGLGVIAKQLYEDRTACNRMFKHADSTVLTLRRSMADDEATDWAAKILQLEQDYKEADVQITATRAMAEQCARTAEAKVRAEMERQIVAIHAEEKAALRRVEEAGRPELERIAGELAAAREKQAVRQKQEGIKESIARFDESARENGARAEQLTTALEKLAALKKSKLDAFPIQGVEIQNGQVYIDGVEREHVNTARLIQFAFEVCELRPNRLGFMVLDGAEALDSDTWAALQEYATGRGYQIVAARVSDGPLKIETAGEQSGDDDLVQKLEQSIKIAQRKKAAEPGGLFVDPQPDAVTYADPAEVAGRGKRR